VVPFFKGKRAVVERIEAHPELTWTAVITGLFFDFGFERAATGIDAKTGKAIIWDDGNVPFSTSNLKIIGETLVKLLTDSTAYEDSKNKYIYTASHTTTQNEVLAAAEKATGKKFEVTNVNGAEIVAQNGEKVAKGDLSGIYPLLQALALTKIEGEALSDYRSLGIFNDKHGVKDVPLEEDVKGLVQKL
jgi:NmrA-like family